MDKDRPENLNNANTEEGNENDESNETPGASNNKKKRSDVWPHFTSSFVNIDNVPTEYAQCIYCSRKYKVAGKTNGGTGNLRNHLTNKHPDRYAKAENVKETFVYSQEKFRETLLKWIISSDQPFTEAQNKAFLEMVASLNPEAKSVSDKTIKRDTMSTFLLEFEKTKLRIKEVPGKISFTLDGWTSKNVLAFVAIRAHYINTNWKYESVLLDFVEVDGHSGQDLSNIFIDCLKRYDIPLSKIMALTMDNVESNNTFMSILAAHGLTIQVNISPDGNRVRCLAHVLNLSVKDIMTHLKISLTPDDDQPEDDVNFSDEEVDDDDEENIDLMTAEDESEDESSGPNNATKDELVSNKPTIFKLRKLVRKIRKSTIKRKKLKKFSKLYGVQYLTPKIDVSTRWNSSFQMLERAFHLKKPLQALCTNEKSLHPFAISELEWIELDKLCKLLKKFDRSTKLLSMERHPTISAYIPTLNWLLDSLKSFIKENCGPMGHAAGKGLEKLQKYEELTDIKHSKLPYLGVFINPALKLNYFKEYKYKNVKEIQKQIAEIFERDYETVNETPVGNERKESDDEFYSHMYKRAKVSKASKEIQKYIQFPLLSPETNILEFWSTQETEFPGLSKLARDVLPIQCASVAVERDFSSASNTMSAKQCAMKADILRARMCLKTWFKD